MAEVLPEKANGIGDRRKTTETEARSPLTKVYACTGVSRQNLCYREGNSQSNEGVAGWVTRWRLALCEYLKSVKLYLCHSG